MPSDFYQELGVPKNADASTLKKAYRKLASELHPDKNPNNPRAEARFKRVNRAFQVLGDPKTRALYDEFGEDALREGFDPEAMRAYRRAGSRSRVRFSPGAPGGVGIDPNDLPGFGDLFGEFFGGRRRAQTPTKGSDVLSEVTVDFASALRGATLQLRVQEDGDPVTVRIPPGAGDGDKVRVRGHGAPGRVGAAPGDLVLVIRVKPHPYFERVGLDLYLDLPLAPAEAYDGAKIPIPTPEGNVTLTIPKRAQSGQVVRLRGRGVKRKKEHGDLYVRFLIRLPDSDDASVKRAIDALQAHMTSDLRADIAF